MLCTITYIWYFRQIIVTSDILIHILHTKSLTKNSEVHFNALCIPSEKNPAKFNILTSQRKVYQTRPIQYLSLEQITTLECVAVAYLML